MMNEMYPDGPITNGDKKLIEMMNKKEEQFWTQTVQESVSNVYWEFRDSLDDEGGERLKEECEHFEKMLMGIVKKYDVNA